MNASRSILELLHQQLASLSPTKTLLLMHPASYPYHRRIVHALLEAESVAYLHLTPEMAALPTFLAALEDAIQPASNVKFATLDLTKAAAQLANAANQFNSFTLLLEGYDCAADPKVDDFVHLLAATLTPQHRIVIFSRRLALGLLNRHAPYCAMLPIQPKQLLVDYAQPHPNKNILEVHALGPGQALIDGRLLDTWDGVLPKCLFYFLVDRAMSTRDDIFETFWPNLEKREATNVFHVTKRKVNEILGQDLTTYGNGFYRLADNVELYYDVVEFLEAVQHAEIAEDDDHAIQLYEQGTHLYRSEFLSTLDQGWIRERREELRNTYADALIGLAQLYTKRAAEDAALGLYMRAAAVMPQREDLARTLMQHYRKHGEHAYALQLFNRLETVLRRELNVTPSPETIKLAQAIRHETQ